MPNYTPGDLKVYNGSTLSGSATGHFGDVYEQGTKYNIQHHHHNYYASSSTTPHALLTEHAHEQYSNGTGKGLALLSFDGGPFGGLGSLVMLKSFMERVAHTQSLRKTPKPCEFFDMISGAGTGGLLAILLGCLELTIDQCIEEHLRFSKNVLSKQTPLNNDSTDSNLHHASVVVDHMAVERFIKQTLRNHGESEDRLLQAPSALSCKVLVKVVCTLDEDTRVLRSYKTQTPDDHDLRYIRLWQAAQATLATSALFHPVTIEYEHQSIIYGTSTNLQISNLQDIFVEAQTHLLDRSQVLTDHLDCLVSVGSMICANTSQNTSADFWPGVLADVCTANKVACQAFCESHVSLATSGQFCRLEVPVDPTLEHSWFSEKHTQLSARVEHYLNSPVTSGRLESCFSRLSRHQLAPGFAVMQEPQLHVEASGKLPVCKAQPSMLPQPEQISTYNPRLAHYRRSQPRVKGTCTWIFKNSEFVTWSRAPCTSALVCTGTVGCGKSFLAAAIIDHMQELQLNTHQRCIHYFFETGHPSLSTLNELLRAMIKQLVLSHDHSRLDPPPGTSKALHDVLRTSGIPPSTDELASLLKMLVDCSAPSLYLIDGFDDLEESQLLDLFGILRRVFADRNSHGSKLVLFSREILGRGIDISRQLTGITQVHSIRLRLSNLSKDIMLFVEAQVHEQQIRRTITADEKLVKEVKKKLILHSDKMFLWIHFQVQMIWNPRFSKNDDELRALIENLPDGLDKTYETCLRRIEGHGDHSHREIASKAFKLVSAAKSPLTPRQAREVVSMSQSNVALRESQILNACVTEYCANLLTTDITNRKVQFAHVSIRQFLENRSTMPKDLLRYHIDPEIANQECMALCLTYLNSLKSSGQLVIGRGAEITQRVPKVIDRGIFKGSKVATMARIFKGMTVREHPSAGNSIPSSPNVDIARLEIHDYFVGNWLSHTRDIIASDPNISTFRRLCWRADPILFPWLHHTNAESGLYQQLAQYSVINQHIPLLRAVRDYLETQKPRLLADAFESQCPGTAVRPVHMAAAMGLVDVLRELSTFCDIGVYDGEQPRRTPIAWAAEKSHFETVEWLLRDRDDRGHNCYRSLDGSMCLVGILAGLDTDEGFWRFNDFARFRWFCTQEDFTQALFAACTKGHISVAKELKRLCKSIADSAHFYWPGFGRCSESSLIAFAAKCEDTRALESLALVFYEEAELKLAIEQILTWTPSRILSASSFLRSPTVLPILARSALWLTTIKHGQLWTEAPNSDQYHWTRITRDVLHTQWARGLTVPRVSKLQATQVSESGSFTVWNNVPDDIHVALLRLEYLNRDPWVNLDQVLYVADYVRRSSRVFLEKIEDINFRRRTNEQFRADLHTSLGAAVMEALIYKVHLKYAFQLRDGEVSQWIGVKWAFLEGVGVKSHLKMRTYWWTFGLGLEYSIRELFHLARCYRTCRQNGRRARRMYLDLKDIGDNCDVSLNFPYGYMKTNGRYVVKIGIVGAIYRWNYRLRRRKNLPFSAADTAYAKAVGLPIPEEPQTFVDAEEHA